jgi:hypothetical protein
LLDSFCIWRIVLQLAKNTKRQLTTLFALNIEGQTMTKNQFLTLCNEHHISPDIALENDDLVQALRERDDEKVQHIIANEF